MLILTVHAVTGAGDDVDPPSIAALFPPSPRGWRPESLQISYDNGARQQMHPAAGGSIPRRSRMTARRLYVRAGRVASMVITSSDIEGVARVDSLTTALRTGGDLPARVRNAGLHPVVDGRGTGVFFTQNGAQIRTYRVGRTGTVTLRCQFLNCGEVLRELSSTVDWRGIDAFIRALDYDPAPAGSPRDP